MKNGVNIEQVLPEVLPKLSSSNFIVFQVYELGLEVGPHHVEWWNMMRRGQDTIIMAPRDHGKSTSIARGFPLWKLKYDSWVTDVLLLGADKASSTESLEKLKDMMARSKHLSYLLPSMKGKNLNSKTEMQLSNGKIVRAKGFMTPLRGRHPQLIVLDDALNETNSSTADLRKKVERRFFQSIFPMKDKGVYSARKKGYRPQIVVVGTAQERGDLYQVLMENPSFLGLRQQAIVNEIKRETLWANRYDYEDLMKLKETVGSIAFSKEYMNIPLSDESAIFPTKLFEWLKDEDLSYASGYNGDMYVTMGVDFSIPGEKEGDYTAIAIMGYDERSDEYVMLYYWRAIPETFEDQVRVVEQCCKDYNVGTGYIEDNMFQKLYVNYFRNNRQLPLMGHTVTNSKKGSLESGVVSFRSIFEARKMRFPYKTSKDKMMTDHIVAEFNGVSRKGAKIGNFSFHDDVVMAMWHALEAHRSPTFKFYF